MNGGSYKHKKIDLSAFAASPSVFSVSNGSSQAFTPRTSVTVVSSSSGNVSMVPPLQLQHKMRHESSSSGSGILYYPNNTNNNTNINKNLTFSDCMSDETNSMAETEGRINRKTPTKSQFQHIDVEQEAYIASTTAISVNSATTAHKCDSLSSQQVTSVQKCQLDNGYDLSSGIESQQHSTSHSNLLPLANTVEIGSLFKSMKLLPFWYRLFSMTAALGFLLLEVGGAFLPKNSRELSGAMNVTSLGVEEAMTPAQSYLLLVHLIVNSVLQHLHFCFGTSLMWPSGYNSTLEMMSLQDRFISAFFSIILGLFAMKSYHVQKWLFIRIEELTGLRVPNSIVEHALYKVIEEISKSSQNNRFQQETQSQKSRDLLKKQVNEYLHRSLYRGIGKSLEKEYISTSIRKGKISTSTVGMLRSCSYLGPSHDVLWGKMENNKDKFFDIDNPEDKKEAKFHSGRICAIILVLCLMLEPIWIARSNINDTYNNYDNTLPFRDSIASKHPTMSSILLYSPHLLFQVQCIIKFILGHWPYHVGSVLVLTVLYRFITDVLIYYPYRHSHRVYTDNIPNRRHTPLAVEATAVSFRWFIITALCLKVVCNLINITMRIQENSDYSNSLFLISIVAALIAIAVTNYVYHGSEKGVDCVNNSEGAYDTGKDVRVGRFSQIISLTISPAKGYRDDRYALNPDASVYEISQLLKQYLSEHIHVKEAPLTRITGLKILALNGARCALITIQGLAAVLALMTGVHVVELFLLWLLTVLILLCIPCAIDAFSVEFFLLFSSGVGLAAGYLLPSEFGPLPSTIRRENVEDSASSPIVFSGAVALLVFSSLLTISCVYNVATLLVTLVIRQHPSLNQTTPTFAQKVTCYISSRRRTFGLVLSTPLILYVIFNGLSLATTHFMKLSSVHTANTANNAPVNLDYLSVGGDKNETETLKSIHILEWIGLLLINIVKGTLSISCQIMMNIISALTTAVNEYSMSREPKPTILEAVTVGFHDFVNSTKGTIGMGSLPAYSLFGSLTTVIYYLLWLFVATIVNIYHFFSFLFDSSTSNTTLVNLKLSILLHLGLTTIALGINRLLLHQVGPVKVYLLSNSFATPVLSRNNGFMTSDDGHHRTFTYDKTDGFVVASLDIFIKKLANGVALLTVVGVSFTVSAVLTQYFVPFSGDTSLYQSSTGNKDRNEFIDIIVTALSLSVPLQVIIFTMTFCGCIGASKGVVSVLNTHIIRAMTHKSRRTGLLKCTDAR